VPGHRHEWDDARSLLLNAYTELVRGEATTIPRVTEMTSTSLALLTAFISVADWIASAKFACNADEPPTGYLPMARQQAEEAVTALQWVLPSTGGDPPSFSQLFDGKRPRPLQEVTAGVAAESNAPGLVIIEAPMGEGKTEAAVHLAETWLRKLGQQGCYFALPTMATANAIFGRFHKDYLRKVHPEAAGVLRLLHGQASVSEEYRQFRIGNVYDSDERRPCGSADAEDWFAYKKRGLLSPYGVGTVDQALLSVLQTKHGFVRLFGLAGKTVIVDEVHAFDFYTREILGRLLAWLRAAGSSVILLSATLPRSTRRSLLESWGASTTPEKEEPYPRVTAVLGDEARSVHISGSAKARRLGLKWVDETDEGLSAELCSAVAEGGCAVYVCNTVGRAQEFFQILQGPAKEQGIAPYLLHARFPFGEREAREADAVARFGKDAGRNGNPPRPERAIMVSTQIIEQSLDVDFDLMVTDLAPVDLLLQRSGRLMRHVGMEPPMPRYSFDEQKPVLWVRTPGMDSPGLPDFGAGRAIYSDHILLRTLLALGSQDRAIEIPGDMPELIEAVYDEARDPDVADDLERRLRAAKSEFQKRVDKLRYEANQRLIKRPEYSGELASVFGEALEEDNPAVHSAFQALTRWSDLPSVTVVCLHSCGGRVYVDRGLEHPVDLSVEPDSVTLTQLMRASMRLSGHAITRHFADAGKAATPQGWRRIAMLRHLRPAVFIDGVVANTEGFALRLDPELGGVIEYPKREEEDEH
jgi:CRISPR-associated endonuclease/helicase Cas3